MRPELLELIVRGGETVAGGERGGLSRDDLPAAHLSTTPKRS